LADQVLAGRAVDPASAPAVVVALATVVVQAATMAWTRGSAGWSKSSIRFWRNCATCGSSVLVVRRRREAAVRKVRRWPIVVRVARPLAAWVAAAADSDRASARPAIAQGGVPAISVAGQDLAVPRATFAARRAVRAAASVTIAKVRRAAARREANASSAANVIRDKSRVNVTSPKTVAGAATTIARSSQSEAELPDLWSQAELGTR
jgi:hypothetical protein